MVPSPGGEGEDEGGQSTDLNFKQAKAEADSLIISNPPRQAQALLNQLNAQTNALHQSQA